MLYQPESGGTPASQKPSGQMALASLILGIVSVITSGCIYSAIVCGALGILFAFLSRGGSDHMPPQAKAGLALSGFGMALTIVIYAAALTLIVFQYGGIDEFLLEYKELYQSMGIN